MPNTEHQERFFEAYIVSKLKAQGWLVGNTSKYDIEPEVRHLFAKNLEFPA